MSDYLSTNIPYHPDSTVLYEKVADEPWSAYLDSCQPASTQGRYDIIVSRPSVSLITQNFETKIQTSSETLIVPDDPFILLKQHLYSDNKISNKLPFCGGALGFFSYDLGRYIEQISSIALNDLSLPDMAIGIYYWAVIVDHKKKKTTLVGDKSDIKTRREWNDIEKLFTSKSQSANNASFNVTQQVRSNMSAETYKEAFNRIKTYIKEGDCYQVNLAQRFNVSVEGSNWIAYKELRKINPSPFSAYMNYPDFQILSNSPERFLSVKEKFVETKPIKGTRPRAKNQKKDLLLLEDLMTSEKDQAENVMIVDLLRNDISKNCMLGSVQVPKLFKVESFPNVHHLVSTITGKLDVQRSD